MLQCDGTATKVLVLGQFFPCISLLFLLFVQPVELNPWQCEQAMCNPCASVPSLVFASSRMLILCTWEGRFMVGEDPYVLPPLCLYPCASPAAVQGWEDVLGEGKDLLIQTHMLRVACVRLTPDPGSCWVPEAVGNGTGA